GSIDDPNKVELDGLVYVMDRLPKGIAECRNIKLVSEEGYYQSGFEVIIPRHRRRNCYRVDKDQMLIEVTRGSSEIYDILTHLTFLYIEAEKIKNYAFDYKGRPSLDWLKLESIVLEGKKITEKNKQITFSYLSSLLGRTFEETEKAYQRLQANVDRNNGLFHIVYWLGKVAYEEQANNQVREVYFSPALRERNGQHIYGERWSNQIKHFLKNSNLHQKPIHIISANLHSVMNYLYARAALPRTVIKGKKFEKIAVELSKSKNSKLRDSVAAYATKHGMTWLDDDTGTGISVQIFDTSKLVTNKLPKSLAVDSQYLEKKTPVIIVMDFAFGEQAYETMDELLKTPEIDGECISLDVKSISIMGKAGILKGSKGDIMIPTSHIFEGTADNYPINNGLKASDFEGNGLKVFEGPMITVLGTSLQNKDILSYFKESSWRAIGLEMEGAHYQKAIQAQAMIRKNISQKVVTRYAYYASDNPLLTGNTLASGSLGLVGVIPTYLITHKILEKIFNPQ
ncbi:MAG: hypothetical protein O6848_03900, partial [Bacteroidetes bacterium]|nr:hypothetical protein [Bacteroidota bacterium]